MEEPNETEATCQAPSAAVAPGGDRTTRAAKTAAVALMQTFVSLVVGLISVPILARSLGRDAYGVWLLMGQAISYLSLVDFGNASIVKLKLATSSGDDGKAVKQELLSTTLLGVLITTPLVAVGGGVIAAWLVFRYADEKVSAPSVATASALLVATFLVMRLASLPTFALFGANMEYRSALTRTLITTANSVLDIIAALTGFGMIGLACNRLIAQVGMGLNLQRAARRHVPWYGFVAFDWSMLASLLKQNASCLFAQWGNMLVEAVDILVVGIAVGAESVPVYTVTSALPRLMFTLFNQAMSGANAGLVGLFGTGDKRRFYFVRTQQEIITLVCLAIIGAVTLAINRQFVSLWVGPEYYGGGSVTALAVAWYFAVITSRHYCNALWAALDFNRMAVVQVVAGLAGLVAGIVGGRMAGIPGAVAGLLVTRLAANLLNAGRLDELLGIPPLEHLAVLSMPLAVALGSCLCGWGVGRMNLPEGWIIAGAVGAAVMVASGSAEWFLGMPTNAKEDLAARLGRLARYLPRIRGPAGT
jgi:O-antigen/teichoic acid export membrane protein